MPKSEPKPNQISEFTGGGFFSGKTQTSPLEANLIDNLRQIGSQNREPKSKAKAKPNFRVYWRRIFSGTTKNSPLEANLIDN